MKKFISAISLILILSTLLCACKDKTDGNISDTSASQTTSSGTSAPSTTSSAPTAVKITPYIDFDGEVTATSTHLPFMDIKVFNSVAGEPYKYQWTQGGCVAGNYVYTCMITDNSVSPAKCCIVKSELESGSVVAKSKEMELGHANDAAYNPDDNVIVVADCGTSGFNIVHILNAETLKLEKSIELPRGAASGTTVCSIAYDSANKRYVAIGAQNDYVYIYNRSFKLVKTIKGFGVTSGGDFNGDFSMQGIVTDGVYLYILEWHGGSRWAAENATTESEVRANFLVMDLSTGKHVKTIDLGIKREVEFAGYLDGKFYIGCNNIRWNGMEFYAVEITTTKK